MFNNNFNRKEFSLFLIQVLKGLGFIWLINLGAKVFGISKDIPTKPSLFKELKLENLLEHYFEDIRNLIKLNF